MRAALPSPSREEMMVVGSESTASGVYPCTVLQVRYPSSLSAPQHCIINLARVCQHTAVVLPPHCGTMYQFALCVPTEVFVTFIAQGSHLQLVRDHIGTDVVVSFDQLAIVFPSTV
jgi:hypothetical protein